MLLLSHSGLEKRKRRLLETSILGRDGFRGTRCLLADRAVAGCSSDAGVGDDAVCTDSVT